MNKEFINQINIILDQQKIDERVKPLIKLYFLGKAKSTDLTIDEIVNQINVLCSRIQNVEFSSNNIITAYSGKAGVLTINKQLFLEGKSSEVIVPVFTKFEEILNQDNRKNYANHIEDFINAGRIAKISNIPMSDKLYTLYEMAEYCYGDIEYKVDELIKDGSWKVSCHNYSEAINELIVVGKDLSNKLIEGIRLFHYEVYNYEAISNPDFEGPYKNEEYQKKAAKISNCVNYLSSETTKLNITERESLIQNIKLFTGCTQEITEKSNTTAYTANPKIANILEAAIRTNEPEISEEYIVSKVQAMLNTKTDYDNRIKHLVIPFFIRSQKIYNWTVDEFQERLNELNLKIDKIVFEDLGNITTMGSTALDKIKLNSRVFFKRNGTPAYPVAETLFHELGHNTDENSREGIETKERLQDSALGGGRFYEWTNTIFERLANGKSFYKNNNAMELSEAGYDALAPLGSMLACALGMSEIEFAKIKDKGKEYEEQLLEKMFPPTDNTDNPSGVDVLKKAKKIFDKYELYTDFSLSKKMANQNLLNEMYAECLDIMKKRIEIELQHGNIENQEEYKKYQMFFLKKINFNFKSASKTDGFRFSKIPLVNDIGFCTDKISRTDLKRISAEQVAMADFGFDNNTLGKYNTAITTKKDKQSFFERLKFISSQENSTPEPARTDSTIENTIDTKVAVPNHEEID